MKINWKVRVRNKAFWLAIVPAVLLLAQAVLALFGLEMDFTDAQKRIVEIVEAVFVVLSILGVVNDPTTAGIQDSNQAMTYEKPKPKGE